MNAKQNKLKKKKILYVTPCWSGLKDVLNKSNYSPTGMPAFFKVLETLSKRGNLIKIIMLTSEKKYLLKKNFIKLENVDIECLHWSVKNIFKSIFLILINFFKITLLIKKNNPDFVYCLGSVGVLGLIPAKLMNIAHGVRYFGINFYYAKYLKKKKLKFLLNHPFVFFSFYIKSNFFLLTNDGSPGNLLFKKIGNKETPFYFWKNGFDDFVLKKKKIKKQKNLFLYYPSRISVKKNQIAAIKLLQLLIKKTNLKIDLILSGHISDKDYFLFLRKYCENQNLNSQVIYEGILKKEQVYLRMKESLAFLSLQLVSNLSNSLLEALYHKSLVVTFKEKSINKFLKNGKSAILINNIEEAANEISKLVNNKKRMSMLRELGKKSLEKSFMSWDMRVKKEIELMDKTINQKL